MRPFQSGDKPLYFSIIEVLPILEWPPYYTSDSPNSNGDKFSLIYGQAIEGCYSYDGHGQRFPSEKVDVFFREGPT
jgi:hypothetical protein